VQERLVVLSREEQADLLVVGDRMRQRISSALFRGWNWSRFESLAGSDAHPVLVVPGGGGRRFAEARHAPQGSILCVIDGSAGSERARRTAACLADMLGLGLLLVTIAKARRSIEAEGVVHVVGRDPAALADVASRDQAALIVVGMGDREVVGDSVARELEATAPVPVLMLSTGAGLPHLVAKAAAEPAIAA
jgi:nucleotide-binding universal stress UspA family protein